jgi:phosphonate transport system permease protein
MRVQGRPDDGSSASRRASSSLRSGARLLQRALRRCAVLVFDAVFLAYMFVMISYVVTWLASGIGIYVAVPEGYLVVLPIVGAVVWGALGTSVGKKAVRFLSGQSSPDPTQEPRRASVLPLSGATGSNPAGPARRPWYRTTWGWGVLLAVLVTLAAGTAISRVDFSRLVQNWPHAAKMLVRLVQPDVSIAGEVVSLTIVTVFMALMATLLAIPVAVILSFLAARNLMRGAVGRTIYFVVRAMASIVRAIEPIIWAIVFVIWVRMGPFAGALALFVCSIADLTKLYSEQLESIDTGPTEAITAVGGRRLQVLLFGVVPQIINPYLSFTLYRWDINVRMGTVIGMVGGGGIGSLLMQYVRVNEWEEVSTCLIAIIVVVWSIDTLSARLRARLA